MRYFTLIFFLFFSLDHLTAQDFQWAATMGSVGYEATTEMDVDNDGNVYTTGTFSGTIDADPGVDVYNLTPVGNQDIFVIKYWSDGSLAWAFSLGSSMFDQASAIHVDNAGNVYIAGGFRSTVDFNPGPSTYNFTSAGHLDIFLLKVDISGNFIWAHQFGSTIEDSVEGIATDPDNNVHICGLFGGTVDFNPSSLVTSNLISTGSQDAYIAKYNSDGDYIWANKFGTTSGEICYDLATDNGGNVYATGLFWGNLDFDPGAGTYLLNAGSFNSKSFGLKWSSNGTFVWAVMFGGNQSNASYGIALNDANDVYMAGSFAGNGDFNPGAGVFTMDAGSNSLYHDVFVIKLDNTSGFIWAKQMGVNGTNQSAFSIDVYDDGRSYVGGLFGGTFDLDPGAGIAEYTASGSSDGFIVELDNDGNHIWSGKIGGGTEDHINDVRVYGNSSVYIGGAFSWNNADIDPTAGILLYPATSNTIDGFVVKIGSCEPIAINQNISICPGETFFAGGDFQSIPGIYEDVYISTGGCDSTVVTNLSLAFEYTPMGIILSCDMNEISLSPLSNANTFLWNTGSDLPNISITESGIFSVEMSSGDCSTIDTAWVTFGNSPVVELSGGYEHCGIGDFITYSAIGNDPYSVEWIGYPLVESDSLAVSNSGDYTLILTDSDGCFTSANISYTVVNTCPGDFNFDGVIGIQDLLMFIPQYGCMGNCCPFDLNNDGTVLVNDLLAFIGNFSTYCP